MTGTPLDLTPFGGLIAALGWAYWALALSIVLFAIWLPKRWWLKLTLGAAVAAGVVYPLFVRPVKHHVDERQQARAAYEQQLAAATALFQERCKSAGETIKRTVQNVDSVVWMKWRSQPLSVTGYSLGGHLATAFNELCGSRAQAYYRSTSAEGASNTQHRCSSRQASGLLTEGPQT
jgi:hypothetical protein